MPTRQIRPRTVIFVVSILIVCGLGYRLLSRSGTGDAGSEPVRPAATAPSAVPATQVAVSAPDPEPSAPADAESTAAAPPADPPPGTSADQGTLEDESAHHLLQAARARLESLLAEIAAPAPLDMYNVDLHSAYVALLALEGGSEAIADLLLHGTVETLRRLVPLTVFRCSDADCRTLSSQHTEDVPARIAEAMLQLAAEGSERSATTLVYYERYRSQTAVPDEVVHLAHRMLDAPQDRLEEDMRLVLNILVNQPSMSAGTMQSIASLAAEPGHPGSNIALGMLTALETDDAETILLGSVGEGVLSSASARGGVALNALSGRVMRETYAGHLDLPVAEALGRSVLPTAGDMHYNTRVPVLRLIVGLESPELRYDLLTQWRAVASEDWMVAGLDDLLQLSLAGTPKGAMKKRINDFMGPKINELYEQLLQQQLQELQER